MVPVLLALGGWQLQRAQDKARLLEQFEARRQAQPLAIRDLNQLADVAYQPVRLSGFFDQTHSVLLDNRTREGRPGVELLQPFFDEPSEQWVLINRGWLPWPDRRQMPVFSTPEGQVRLSGWVYRPAESAVTLIQTQNSIGWPRVTSNADAPGLWRELDRPGVSFEVRMRPGPGSYQVDWPIVAMSPQKHQGYAVQWFALAAALIALFVYFGVHNARESRDEHSRSPA